jgi:acetyl esterase
MALDPQVEFVLGLVEKADLPEFWELSPEQARELFEATVPKLDAAPQDVFRWEQQNIPGPNGEIPVRTYVPREPGEEEWLPILVFFHGGGFVIGGLDSYDSLCRNIANRADCIVVSVDYRLAPEHKFPAAPEDCYAALCWVAENAFDLDGDPDRIALAGDSAGGNLTAVTALRARDEGGPALVLHMPLYPVIGPEPETGSHHEFAEGYLLTRRNLLWFYDHYFRSDADKQDVRFSPLVAKDLSGMPPALVVVAGFDPLRDEGMAYAEALRAAGNQVTLTNYEGMIHGFLSMSDVLDQANVCLDECAAALKAAFGTA